MQASPAQTLPSRGRLMDLEPEIRLPKMTDTNEMIGACPRYSRAFSEKYIEKMKCKYQNWKEAMEVHDTQKAISEFEQKIGSNTTTLEIPEPPKPDFDASLARYLFAKNSQTSRAAKPESLHASEPVPLKSTRLLKRPPFKISEKAKSGLSIPMYDKKDKERHDLCMDLVNQRLLRLDKLDILKKQKRTRSLSKAAREKREYTFKSDTKATATESEETFRPITANTQEAITKLNLFDERLKEQRKRKAEEANKRKLIEMKIAAGVISSAEEDTDNFQLTCLPPGAAIEPPKPC